ncbi:hypothetical protein [Thermodesulfovibrio sp.]|uniref:hypothetical protein n=2 Tax=Thermodesulfovibrio TaxID=28261 RepID=UPI0030A4E19F
MEKETYISKETLHSEPFPFCHSEPSLSHSEPSPLRHSDPSICHSEPKAKNLLLELNKIAEFVKERYNTHIWFVEIMGKRHSYIAGHKEDSFLPPELIYINDRYAAVSNEWERITEKDEIISTIKMLLSEETTP